VLPNFVFTKCHRKGGAQGGGGEDVRAREKEEDEGEGEDVRAREK
jgi:hypothetical protein